MPFNDTQTGQLKAPLDRSVVKEREQAGRKLSYIEAWQAIAEANRIFGFDSWDRETVVMQQLGETRTVLDKYNKEQFRVAYMAKVKVTVWTPDAGQGVIREGTGFGSGIDKDPDQAHESAIKEAESDAMKRALMTFGNPFGLALYDKTQANVAEAPVPTISQTQADDLEALIEDVGADRGKFLDYLKVNALGLLPASDFEWAMKALEAKRAK